MSTRAKVICAVLAVVFAYFSFDGPEHARRIFDPVGYWTEKRTYTIEALDHNRNLIASCELDLVMIERIKDLKLQQAVLDGRTPEEAQIELLTEINETKGQCDDFRDWLKEKQADLEMFDRELARHK